MKILFFGDIVGRIGREAVSSLLPSLVKEYDIDFVIANGENASHEPLYPTLFFGLASERENLYPAVEARVDQMFKDGLVEEDQRLIAKYGRTPHAFNAIGVKELYPYFDGQISLEEAKNAIKEATRHYIKRQETFFRHQFDITWVSSSSEILAILKRQA